MERSIAYGTRRAFAIAALAVAACAHGGSSGEPVAPGMLRLTVNRQAVTVPAGSNMLEVLRGEAGALRLGELAASTANQPLLVIDGVMVNNTAQMLALIAAADVQGVRLLRPAEAFQRYGPAASAGAVVLTTKSGR